MFNSNLIIDCRGYCVACKKELNKHKFSAKQWDPESCTEVIETDATGKINFPENGNKAQVFDKLLKNNGK